MSTVPAELVDLILSNLAGRHLEAPSLVCRAWLPIARSRYTLKIHNRRAFRGLDCILDAECTFLPAVRNIIVVQADSRIILPNLSRFSALDNLELHGIHLRADIPSLPRLAKVVLFFCIFEDFKSTIQSLENITASGTLRDFTWDGTRWYIGDDDDDTQRAAIEAKRTFTFERMYLGWYVRFRCDVFPFCLRAKNLTLGCYLSDDWIPVAAEYLRALGSIIEIIFLKDCYSLGRDAPAGGLVDLAPLTQLHTLKLGSALFYTITNAGDTQLLLDRYVETVLGQITAPLRSLVLCVDAPPDSPAQDPAKTTSLTHLFSILDHNPRLRAIPKLGFVMGRPCQHWLYQEVDGPASDRATAAAVASTLRASVPDAWLGRVYFDEALI
ncbi:hypothetical protein MKEN_01461700 [Mycena kentingensis (nom. inval.)]|nr:hypothetical protein MKEN_01461700 [Mycena kentingensis (nom. inval.)]